jgi:tetratricopeptide (TPR) repeat protein
MGLILGTLGYEFISNPIRADQEEIPSTRQILWNSLTKNPQKDFATTYATLGLLSLTTVLGGALVLSEASKRKQLGDEGQEGKGLVTYLVTATVIGLLFMAFQAGRLRFLSTGAGASAEQSTLERLRVAADATASILSTFYVFVFVLMLIGLATVLMNGRESRSSSGSAAAWVALVLGSAVAILLINTTNLDVIQADIVYKQADPWDKRAMRERNPAIWDLAISEYNHALELAPQEDFYYLWLGRAYLEQSSVITDKVAQQQLMEVAKDKLLQARRINPLNTDHSANLARLHTRWAELASSDVERTSKANQALEYYAQAHQLSPNNAVILNEWAMLLAGLFGDCEAGIAKLDESLALDSEYEVTYQNLGNVALTCGDRAEGEERRAYYAMAEEAYMAQMELESCNLQVYTALGYAQSQMGDNEKSIETNLNGLKCVADPTSPNTVQFHRNLAILYQLQGDLESAVIHARSAAQAAGSNYNSMLDAARILVSLNALEDAYQVAQRIETLDLQQWSQLRDLAVLYLQTGHPGDGLQPAQKALENAPEDKRLEVQELLDTLQSQTTS